MKRKDFIKLLNRNGWYFLRCGGNHDIYTNGVDSESVPRHNEINDYTIKAIIKRRDLK